MGRRARRNDSYGGAQRMGGGAFSPLLWHIALKLPPNEKVIPDDVKRERGKKARADALKKLDITDEQVIEARRAFEAGEKKCKELAAIYGISYGRMYAILNYQTRTCGMP